MSKGKNGGAAKNEKEWMDDKRRLNENANQYASRVASEFWRAKEAAGPIQLTRSELVAIVRTAWLEGHEPPKDVAVGG